MLLSIYQVKKLLNFYFIKGAKTMPDMWVSKEVRELCYKNKGTFDDKGKPRTVVHHIDFNHDNNDPENLIFLSVSEHNSLHGRNRPSSYYDRFRGKSNPNADGHSMLGKHHSEETKLKMRNSQISDFGRKFIEHYGFERKDNDALWMREYRYHKKHNKCSWE